MAENAVGAGTTHGFAPPLPPNRAGVTPASGCPLGDFTSIVMMAGTHIGALRSNISLIPITLDCTQLEKLPFLTHTETGRARRKASGNSLCAPCASA